MRETLLELRLSNWNHWYSGGYILNQSQGVNLKGICVILSFLYLSYNSNKPQTIRNGQARYKSSGGAGKNNGNCNIRTETSTTQKVIALVSLLHPTKIIPKTLDPATPLILKNQWPLLIYEVSINCCPLRTKRSHALFENS